MSESRAYTADGNWRVLLTAWRQNFFVYNAIGASIEAQHWEETTTFLFFKKEGWASKEIDFIAVEASFEGILPTMGPGAARRIDRRVKARVADVRIESAGVGLSMDAEKGSGLPDLGTATSGGTPKLDVRRVRATGLATIGTETLHLTEVVAE